MKIFINGVIFYFFIVKFDLSFCENADVPDTVIFANILFRHGDRTPIDPYPNDPYNNEKVWPVPFGQLTNLGKQEHLMLGRWFRERYNHMLPNSYSLYDVFVQSTDVDRTLMSAEANLAGLYPPSGNQVWDSLKWMPIPVHTIPEKQDNILAGKKHCPRYNTERKNVLNSLKFTQLIRENEKMLNYLTKMAGKKINSLDEIEFLYNTLYIETLYNKTLPEWTKSVYPDKLKELAELSFTVPAYNKILARLKIGNLIGEMVDKMSLKAKGALVPDRKVWIYSAHDETLANFLMALNIFEPHCPPYASAVLIELRTNKKSQYTVTISYKNSSSEPNVMTLPGCLPNCPLSQFIKLTRDLIPDDWERECLISENYRLHESPNYSSVPGIFMSAIVILLLAILLTVCFVFWHIKYQSSQYYVRLGTD